MIMSLFNFLKFFMIFILFVIFFYLVFGRKYIFIYFDIIGQFFLSIGCLYNNKVIDKNMCDEVLVVFYVID